MGHDVLVRMEGVKRYFTVRQADGRKVPLRAVDGIDLTIRRGETFGLVGESGCGKSTLGKALLRLWPLTEGRIVFDGADIAQLRGGASAARRR